MAERTAVIVEDDPDIALLLEDILAMSGFSVVKASRGQAGLEAIREHRPDLVTLDLGLPDLDGIEVCRQARLLTDAYIIMITARADEIDRLVGLEIGADDFVAKPFSPREVQARVAALFRRPRRILSAQPGNGNRVDSGGRPGDHLAPAPHGATVAPGRGAQALRHGDLTIDVEARIASVNGSEIALTRLEFDILSTMVSGPHRVWSRDALLRQVWGGTWVGDQHLVEVHMGNLRRKLAQTLGDRRAIVTVRGVGYRLGPESSLQALAST